MGNLFVNVIDSSYNFLFHPINSAPANASGATKTLRAMGALAVGIFSLGGAYLAVGILSRSIKTYRDFRHDQAEKAKKIDDFVKSGAKLTMGVYVSPIRLSDSIEEDPVKVILDQVNKVHDQVNNAEQVRWFPGWLDIQLLDIKGIANTKLSHGEKLRLYVGLYDLLNNSKHYKSKVTEASRTISWIQDRLIETLIDYIIKDPDLSIMKPSPTDKEKALQMEIKELIKVLEFVLGDKVQSWVKTEIQGLHMQNEEVTKKVLYSPERKREFIATNQKRIEALNSVAGSLKSYIAYLQNQLDKPYLW